MSQVDNSQGPTDACSYLPHRFNVVPWGEIGIRMPSEFVDSLNEALAVRARMESLGADDVHVYDIVDGLFY